jgi:hypothetical protein
MRRWRLVVTGFACVILVTGGYLAGTRHMLAPSPLAAADDCQTFPETGWQVCGAFLTYWKTHGGLAQQGYPISSTFQEKSETDGKTYTVQYFERAVFEAHPENQPPNDVLLSLLGSQKYKAKYGTGAPPAAPAPAPSSPSTGASGYPKRMVSGSLAVTIFAVDDPAKTGIFTPDPGMRCVAFDVQVENLGGKSLYVGGSRSALKTSDNRQYSNGICGNESPDIAPGDIAPGEKIRGWLSFAIAADGKLATFKWTGNGTDAVTFGF